MDSYEKMEEEMNSFKKYLKMTEDLLCDAKKWEILSKYTESIEDKENYKKLSNTLYNMFMEQHQKIGEMFKGE